MEQLKERVKELPPEERLDTGRFSQGNRGQSVHSAALGKARQQAYPLGSPSA